MHKDRIISIAASVYAGYYFLPIIFYNIPFSNIGGILFLIYVSVLVIYIPKIFISRQLFIVYSFAIVYILLTPHPDNGLNTAWFLKDFMPVFIGVSYYTYFLKFRVNKYSNSIFYDFIFVSLIVSSIIAIIGLYFYPNASRDLASSVYGDEQMVSFYRSRGIVGYGFITSLTYFIPILILLLRKEERLYYKIIFSVFIIIISYAVIKAQYATQFVLFFLALIFSLFSAKRIRNNLVIFIVLIIPFSFLSDQFYTELFHFIADLFPGTVLYDRFIDVEETLMSGGIEEAQTHLSGRYQRIPFLINEFQKNPLFGGGETTGHVFWLDHLSLYGLVGTTPWIILIIDNLRLVRKRLKETYVYYLIALSMFILLGFMKGSGTVEQLLMLFTILPLGLSLYEKQTKEVQSYRINTKYAPHKIRFY